MADAVAKQTQAADNLEQLVSWFEDSELATTDARRAAERDRDYTDGKQLTQRELSTLRKRGQPDNINNEIRRKVDFLTGYEATQRTDPKAFPRNPDDEEAAEAATDMLRYQEEAGDLDQVFSDVWENMLVEGYGGVEVLGPKQSNPNVIDVVMWPWDRLFYDPHSSKPDFSDARYKGGLIWLDADVAKSRYPGAETAIESTIAQEPVNSETYEDKPRVAWATQGKRPRVRIVQMYYQDGEAWKWCLFTRGGVIKSGDVQFVDSDGDSDCPMILQSAYVDRDNNRYGMVREFIGPQDEINKRASKALHSLAVTGGYYEDGAIDDVDAFKAEIAKPDGWAKVNSLQGIQPRDKMGDISANLQLLQEAKQAIQLKGPNAALSGKQSQEASGRAIRASQEGGIVELARLRDRHTHFKRQVYRAVWNRVRQFITEQTWIRVTDDEKKLRFVGFNRPLTFAESAAKELQNQGVPEEQIDGQVAQAAMDMGVHPEQQVGVENVPAQMDMDILIEPSTESINIQEEQFEQLVNLAQIIPMPPEVYLKASSLRNKDELLDIVNGAKPSPDQQNAALELKVRGILAQIAKDEAAADQSQSQAVLNVTKAGVSIADAMMTPAWSPPDQGTGAAAPPPQAPPPQPAPMQQPIQPPPQPGAFSQVPPT